MGAPETSVSDTVPAVPSPGSSVKRDIIRLFPWLVLIISLSVTWLAWHSAMTATNEAQKDYFDFRVRESISHIERRMQAYEQMLLGVKGLYGASVNVERSEFRNYVVALHLADNYPGIQGVGFSQIVPAAEKARHQAAVRKQGFPGYEIYPEGQRDPYTSIVYLEPFADRNLRAFGYDMYSEPVRREAMARARDTNNAAISGKVRLVQESGKQEQAGFLMYVPIYRNDQPHGTTAERRTNIIGWAYAPFRINDLMHGIEGEQAGDLDIEIYDGKEAKNNALMYDSSGSLAAESLRQTPLQSTNTTTIAGHSWTIAIRAMPSFYDRIDSGRPKIIAMTGFMTSLLLAWLAWLLVTGRERAIRTAQKMNRELIETEAKFRTVADYTYDWEYWQGPKLEIRYMTPSCERITGYTQTEFIADPGLLSRIIHPEDRYLMEAHMRDATYEDEAIVDFRILRRDGKTCWIAHGCRAVYDSNGEFIGRRASNRDITDRKQAEARLELAASVFTHAREGIMITDANGTIIEVNDTFTHITGYSREEAIGRNPRMLKSGRHDPGFYATMWQDIAVKGHWDGEIWNRRKDGTVFAEILTISAVRDAAGKIQNHVALFTDITPIKEHQQQLELIAHYDALTGLPNRVLLADRLRLAIAQSQRRKRLLAVVYLDLDGFKAVNDGYGHDVGDELLIALAQRMKTALREGDTLARIGGDEFIAVLVDLERPQDCEPVLTRLLLAAANPVTIRQLVLHISASIGVALYPQAGTDADLLLRHADQAMYQAKQAGKNRYQMFEAGAQ